MLLAVAVLSLLLGNVVAIAQTNLKRMLAYSAIANAGFVLLGFSTGQAVGYQAALNFTIAYVLTTLAAFGMILMLSRSGFEHDEIADFKGLSSRDPLLAALMLVVMFSTAGVPPFVGFWAKLWIIQALLASGHTWLATFAVLISVVGAFYYLRVVWYMYFEAPRRSTAAPSTTAHAIDSGAQYRWRCWRSGCCRTRCWTCASTCSLNLPADCLPVLAMVGSSAIDARRQRVGASGGWFHHNGLKSSHGGAID